MKYYIIAGEASGDLHGSNLIKEIRKLDPAAHIRCWGGDKMQAAGAELVKHYRDLAFMGFSEVLMNLRTILGNLKFCKEDILAFKPDALILIDYPGFNLRITKWAKQQSIFGKNAGKIIFYISPQVWAWKENRVRQMKASIDKMLVILPFEKKYFREKWNWEVEYVGHPLLEEVGDGSLSLESITSVNEFADKRIGKSQGRKLVALLPGSRKQEILKKLPVMLAVSKEFPDTDFMVAKAPGLDDSFYDPILKGFQNVSSVSGKTYSLLRQSDAALVTSGTATLETALIGVPQVVCYKGSFISYEIGKRVVKVKYISLVNLIMDKPVVKELIQKDLTVENLKNELERILSDSNRITQMKKDYAELRSMLSAGGNASAKAAAAIHKVIKGTG